MAVNSIGAGQQRRGRETHYELAKHDLEDLVRELAGTGAARLPAEDQLAADLGFSRPTIRSALLALQSEGKIQRQHGVGTFINRHALSTDTNLAEDRPFLDILDSLGYDSDTRIVRLATEPMTEEVAARIGVPQGDAVVIDRLFLASERPVVLSRDTIPLALIQDPPDQLTAERSTFCFVRRWLGQRVRYSVTSITAISAPGDVALAIALEPGTPLLLLDHLHIGDADAPIGITQAYVDSEVLAFSVIRTSSEL